MWNWEVTLENRETAEQKVVKGLGYENEELARMMLGTWLRNFLPSRYLYKSFAKVVYVSEKETNEEGTCL